MRVTVSLVLRNIKSINKYNKGKNDVFKSETIFGWLILSSKTIFYLVRLNNDARAKQKKKLGKF